MDCVLRDSVSTQDFVGNIKRNDVLTQVILEGLGIAEQVDIFCGIQKTNIEAMNDIEGMDKIIRIIQLFSKNVEEKIKNDLQIDDREVINGGEQLRLTLGKAIWRSLYLKTKK